MCTPFSQVSGEVILAAATDFYQLFVLQGITSPLAAPQVPLWDEFFSNTWDIFFFNFLQFFLKSSLGWYELTQYHISESLLFVKYTYSLSVFASQKTFSIKYWNTGENWKLQIIFQDGVPIFSEVIPRPTSEGLIIDPIYWLLDHSIC